MDDPYFSAGSWPPEAAGPEYADYSGTPEYADRGAAQGAGRHRELAKPGDVWQRMAAAPWPPLETPPRAVPAAASEPGPGWPHVPLSSGPRPAAQRSGAAPAGGRAGARPQPPVGSPFGGYESFPGHPPRGHESFPDYPPRGHDGYDAGRPAALDSWPHAGRPSVRRDGTESPGAGSRRPHAPGDGPSRRRGAADAATSLLAGPAPATHRRTRATGSPAGPAAVRPSSDGRTRPGWLWFATVAALVSFTAGALLAAFPSATGSPLLQAVLVLAGLTSYAGGAALARRTSREDTLRGSSPVIAASLAAGAAFFIGHLLG